VARRAPDQSLADGAHEEGASCEGETEEKKTKETNRMCVMSDTWVILGPKSR
jgi:hypothetical protein